MTFAVNLMCSAEGVRQPCAACQSAGALLTARGFRVHHSTRHDALRAAANGGYGFDACFVPVARDEPAVADAALALLSNVRVMLVAETPAMLPDPLPANARAITPREFERGEFEF